MDGWDADALRPLIIGAALAAAAFFAARTRATKHGSENRLRPTLVSYFMLVLMLSIFCLLVYIGRREISLDQIAWWRGLLIAATIGGAWWYWYMHTRIVYWTDDGVGVRAPFLSPKFIRWDEVTWAGVTWSGDQQIRSAHSKISFTTFHGGVADLIAATKRYVSASLVEFS